MPTLNQPDPSPGTEMEAAAPAPELEPAATDAAPMDASPVESSPTNPQGDTPKSLADAIDLALADKTEASAESPTADKAKEVTPPAKTPDASKPANPAPSGAADANAEKKEEGEEELPPFHKHPRFQKVIKERDDAKAELDGFRQDAETFRGLNAYMTEHGVSDQDVNDSLEITAFIRTGRFAEALEKLRPIYQTLQRQTGEILPDDVGALVENGEMTETAAQELARTRAELQQRQERERYLSEQEQRAEQVQAAQNAQAIEGAVNQWQARIEASNPDFEVVRSDVFNRLRLAHAATPARNPQEAVALAEKALADAVAYAKQFRAEAARRPVAPPPVVNTSAPNPKPAPKTLADVVDLALNEA